jgi:hypothetical protein
VPATDCSKDNNDFMPKDAPKDGGCIVARREIAFVPHTPLKLPIELDQVCLGFKCPEGKTCVLDKNGMATCKSQKVPPGCNDVGQTGCMTSTSSGMGGAGMGGMSAATGGGLPHCATSNCVGCPDDCVTIKGTGFSTCHKPVDMPVCMGAVVGCCRDSDCADAGTGAHCRNKLACNELSKNFTCQQDQWTGDTCSEPGTVPVPAGVLGFQVNTCVANECGTGCTGGRICYPVLAGCCGVLKFTCIPPEEGCCASATCEMGKGCLIDPHRTPELQCDECPMNATTGSQ